MSTVDEYHYTVQAIAVKLDHTSQIQRLTLLTTVSLPMLEGYVEASIISCQNIQSYISMVRMSAETLFIDFCVHIHITGHSYITDVEPGVFQMV